MYITNNEYAEPSFESEDAACPETEQCPIIFESDNPEYSLEKTGDAVSLCAQTVFGIQVLYPWQRLVIANILDAVDASNAAAAHERKPLPTAGEPVSELYDEDGILRGSQIGEITLFSGAGSVAG